jgi:hypothetical protein
MIEDDFTLKRRLQASRAEPRTYRWDKTGRPEVNVPRGLVKDKKEAGNAPKSSPFKDFLVKR